MTRRAGIYVRLSPRPDRNYATLADQEAAASALAQRLGWQVVDTFRDEGETAWKRNRKRPEWHRMLAAVDAGAIDALVAYDLDRVARRVRDLEDLLDRAEDGRVQVKVATGEIDLSTSAGRFVAQMLIAHAQMSSADTSRRVAAQCEARAAAGRPHGGTRPYGYTASGRQLIPEEAAVVREMARRVLGGQPLGVVADDLDRRGVPTVNGARWHAYRVGRILRNPTVAGMSVHRGLAVGDGGWEPILERGQWEQVCRVLSANTGRRRGSRDRPYLVSTLVVCGECGTRMRVKTGSPRVPRRYVCSSATPYRGCGKVTAALHRVEEVVASRLEVLLAAGGGVPGGGGDGGAAARAQLELEAAERTLAALAAEFGAGTVTAGEWQAARAPAEARRRAARQVLDARPPGIAAITGGRPWEALDDYERRAVAHALVGSVVVGPAPVRGGRFDPGRVSVVWR